MNTILFDDKTRDALLPLTFTKPIAYLRMGILTFKERWERTLDRELTCLTEQYLAKKFPMKEENVNLFINSSVFPDVNLINKLAELQEKQAILSGNKVIAFNGSIASLKDVLEENLKGVSVMEYTPDLQIDNTWDIFKKNGEALQFDFDLITQGRKTQKISSTNGLIDEDQIFIEEGAKLEFVTLNASNGPIYIGKDAEVMEGSVIRGPFALCDHSTVKLSAKIYGPTTIGPHSKVGGEINNCVITGFTNKAHDGFLGNSVIGEWCNIGADSNNSNLKNNYAEVRLWSYNSERFEKTGLQFCGLIMGDHSKCGINTMFNTGTVVGVNANIFGSGFPRNFVPSFSWGGAAGFTLYTKPKAFEVAEKVMERRNLAFDEVEREIMENIFNLTQKYRKF